MNLNKMLFQVILALLAVFFMLLSSYNLASAAFAAVYFVLIFQVLYARESRAFGLAAIAAVTSLILALRFKYLTWGDPWYEYAMIVRIIEHGSLAREFYPLQQPTLHLGIASLAMITQIDAMLLQKFVTPLISVLSVVALYKLVRELFKDEELAILSGLLLLAGTPYLHWTAQAVRESIGIPMLLLAVYFSFRAVRTLKPQYMLASVLLIAGLVLTHNFSAAVFLLSWLSFSCSYVYFSGDTRASLPSLLLFLISIVLALSWWSASGFYHDAFESALKLVFPFMPVPAFIGTVVLLYALPVWRPYVIEQLRLALQKLLEKQAVYASILFVSILFALIAVNLVLGKFYLVLSYPPSMMFNGFVMIGLSLAGLNFFLDLRRLPVLVWLAALAALLALSTLRVIPFGDPLRFMEFLYIPLAVVAAAGLKRILSKISSRGFASYMVAAFVTASLITSFPAIVLFGTPFEKGSMFYDDRNWVIEHPSSEINAIEWLDERRIVGNLYTDNYVHYAAQWINYDNTVQIDNRARGAVANPDGLPKHENYILITERMKNYAEFSEGMMHQRHPLQEWEIERLHAGASQIYDGGEAKIFYKGW